MTISDLSTTALSKREAALLAAVPTGPLVNGQWRDACFCGFGRDQFPRPVPYPAACSPQAWAATTPVQLVTTLMRYDPDVSLGGVWMDPVLPESYGTLHISNAPMGASRITIDIAGSDVSVRGLPEGMKFHRGYLPWVGDLMEQSESQADE